MVKSFDFESSSEDDDSIYSSHATLFDDNYKFIRNFL